MNDIDDRVATEVMGWRRYDAKTGAEWCEPDQDVGGVVGIVRHLVSEWSPSTRIDHAWEVVEKMIATHDDGDFHLEHLYNYWRVGFCGRDEWFTDASTAPMAICLAALEAVK